MNLVKSIQGEDLDTLLAKEKFVILSCLADWSGPCRVMGTIVGQLATQYSQQVKIVKLDTGSNLLTVQRLGLKSVPTILVFQAGQMVAEFVGITPYEQLSQTIDQLLRMSLVAG
ncbi:thioredoxin family protein [Alkalinema sp. FACHB-956]|uniref:thioredoxin family protein n=1 Tax=Alkalinema sp. FACHB-956 TaxID=2692768 RepID=UPI0016854545|nr:thioredoxin family protein [Alkalinema sp. FACHB-956]MBD2325291.1 thioredoxin family protein [Alkalinema sp. FACHB-956]